MTRHNHQFSFALFLAVMLGFSTVTVTTSVSHDQPLPVEVVASSVTTKVKANPNLVMSVIPEEISVTKVKANPNLVMSVIPEEISVTVGETFIIAVAISTLDNATDLYAWQVHLYFDPRILQCENVFLPPEHIFSCTYTVNDLLEEHNYTEIHAPLQRIANDEGNVLAGEALVGKNKVSLNGSAILCQIKFKAVYVGQSALILSDIFSPGTYILNPELEATVPSLIHGKVICK